MGHMDAYVRRGGQTDAELLATVQVRLYKHPGWSLDAVSAGQLTPGPVGGVEVFVERHDEFLSEGQVVEQTIKHLLGDLRSLAVRETRPD
jgi:hypothetical protein